MGIDKHQGPELATIVGALCERTKTLREMAEWARCYYETVDHYDEQAAKKFLRPVIYEPLLALRERLAQLDLWSRDHLSELINNVVAEYGLKKAKIAQPVRIALTGSSVSPPIDVTLQLAGKDRALARLDQALTFVNMRKHQL
jgi:glutamyl-tRNA synthetase